MVMSWKLCIFASENNKKKTDIMSRDDRANVNEYIYRFFLHIMDSSEAGVIADAMEDDVMTDIEETADKESWHSGDIEVAMKRVLLKRLVPEDYYDE